MNDQNKIKELEYKLQLLQNRQVQFEKEIQDLQYELYLLSEKSEFSDVRTNLTSSKQEKSPPQPSILSEPQQSFTESRPKSHSLPQSKNFALPNLPSNLERFIGENLINKIGILVLVIGVGIGVNYAIDHDLISPLARILLGYLLGIGLLGTAALLRKKYDGFSAVLLSGAMTIFYFITYAAFAIYDLIPNMVAFIMMVIFTIFTVLAALVYNRQVIAVIGLVGAYAVPFLLSTESSEALVLFLYISLINIGICFLAFRKYWKFLYFSSFFITWLIYIAWMIEVRIIEQNFWLGFGFLTLFFLIFYVTFLAYKLLRKETFSKTDVLLLLANSLFYFGLGYFWVDAIETTEKLVGLFAILNACLHFAVAQVIYRQKLADSSLLRLVVGLVLLFVTLAIPIQMEGNWITLVWVALAVVLFWVGKTQKVAFYANTSFPIMILALISMAMDWESNYELYNAENYLAFWNLNFLTSVLFTAGFGIITYFNHKYPLAKNEKVSPAADLKQLLIPGVFLFALYYTFYLEIGNYWESMSLANQSEAINPDLDPYFFDGNWNLKHFKNIWQQNFALFFLSALAFYNIYFLRSKILALLNSILIAISLLIFLSNELFDHDALRNSYLNIPKEATFPTNSFYILFRYISFALVVLSGLALWRYIQSNLLPSQWRRAVELFLHGVAIWILGNEVIHWLALTDRYNFTEFGLTIFWGVYSLILISLGIWKRRKHLRIAGIIWFGITLAKLVFFDLSHMSTVAKTIVFVSLGVLLLIISFLYNKYKHLITNDLPL